MLVVMTDQALPAAFSLLFCCFNPRPPLPSSLLSLRRTVFSCSVVVVEVSLAATTFQSWCCAACCSGVRAANTPGEEAAMVALLSGDVTCRVDRTVRP